MSKSRVLLRIILIGLIIGLLAVGGSIYFRGRPDYYWSRTKKAINAKDYSTARLHLTNLVRKHPKHAQGYERLSEVILEEARRTIGRPTSCAQPQAMIALVKAAELRPNDLALQRRTLGALIQARQLGKATSIAEAVHKAEPKNGDALFVLAWQAVEKRDQAKAEKYLSALLNDTEVASSHVFQTFFLQASLYETLEDKERANASLESASSFAAQLKPDDLRLLTRRDREAMLALLLMYQARAEEVSDGLRRSKSVIDACERLQTAQLLDTRPGERGRPIGCFVQREVPHDPLGRNAEAGPR